MKNICRGKDGCIDVSKKGPGIIIAKSSSLFIAMDY